MPNGGRVSRSAPEALTIAVLTYRRPGDLAALLPLLLQQAADVADLIPRRRILVVDNDPDASARSIATTGPAMHVVYVHEPEPGIAAARNRALDESAGDDLLVFIDDDERPQDSWLGALLRLQRESGATAVVGPVVSRFAAEPDPFIRAGRFFDRRRLPTGTEVDVAATNNLLLDLGRVRALGLRFDVASGLTGGEDTLFTRGLRAHGDRIVWCDEAVVHDIVPEARATRRWVLLRALSSGNSWGLTSLQLAPSVIARARVFGSLHAQGLARVGGGAAQALVGLASGRLAHRARGLRSMARGAGMLLGAWRIPYREYRRRP